jgi:CheY-like chemotaxis protein
MYPLLDPAGAKDSAFRKVLVVQTEPTLRLGFAYALSDATVRVETAANGNETLEAVKAGRFDLVLLDLRMPGMDGLQVIETLRRENNRIAVVLCTTLHQPNAALRAMGLGVVDFLIKPAAPADIRRVVEFVLGPPRSRLAQALHAARSGQPETALGILEAAHQDPDPTESCWIKALKRVVEADAGGEMTQLEEEVRSCFPALAFNPPA